MTKRLSYLIAMEYRIMTKFSLCSIVLLIVAAPVPAQIDNGSPPGLPFVPPTIGIKLDVSWFGDPSFFAFNALADINRDGWLGGPEDFQELTNVYQQYGFRLEDGAQTPPGATNLDLNLDGRVDLNDLHGPFGLIAYTEAIHDWLVETGRVVPTDENLPDWVAVQMRGVAPFCLLRNDPNVDGCVTFQETVRVANNVGMGSIDKSATWRNGDFNGDGMVDETEAMDCWAAYLEGCRAP